MLVPGKLAGGLGKLTDVLGGVTEVLDEPADVLDWTPVVGDMRLAVLVAVCAVLASYTDLFVL